MGLIRAKVAVRSDFVTEPQIQAELKYKKGGKRYSNNKDDVQDGELYMLLREFCTIFLVLPSIDGFIPADAALLDSVNRGSHGCSLCFR